MARTAAGGTTLAAGHVPRHWRVFALILFAPSEEPRLGDPLGMARGCTTLAAGRGPRHWRVFALILFAPSEEPRVAPPSD